MYNVFLKKILLGSVVLALVASCSDDDSDDWGNENVSGPAMLNLDSIELSDSLYSWYLERMASCGDSCEGDFNIVFPGRTSSGSKESSSSSAKVSSSSGKSSSSGTSSSSATSSAAKDSDEDDDYEDATKVRLLPPAGFYGELTIPVPAPEYGGKIRCTFDGSMPTASTAEFVEPYEVKRNRAVRCAEFVGDSIVRKSSHTFFINENVSMPVVSRVLSNTTVQKHQFFGTQSSL